LPEKSNGFVQNQEKIQTGNEIQVTVTPDANNSPIIIFGVEVIDKNEIITLKNISNQTIDMKDFILVDPQINNMKKFKEETLIKAGNSILIINGDENSEYALKNEYWQPEFVINETLDEIILVNQAGRILWSYINYDD
jgi:hypothetical protein